MNSQSPVRIGAVGTALPPFRIIQEEADRLMTRYYEGELRPRTLDVLHKVLAHPSIKQRFMSVDSIEELLTLKNEDPDVRIERFTRWAVKLSEEAILKALGERNLSPGDITHLLVNTCTGYLCPGISTYLIEKLGLRRDIFAYDMVGSGCGGAIPNLQLAEQVLRSNPDAIVMSVSVEICSATYQMGDDIALVISNAVFGDGAAAALLWTRPDGPSLESTTTRFAPEYRDDVRYVYRGGQLHNRLTPQLPGIIGETVPPMIRELLQSANLTLDDIDHWAIHSGGAKMIEVLKEKLQIPEPKLSITREILSSCGNMSSPTVLFELSRIIDHGVRPGQWCLMTAFGAGLSMHACLLRG